MTTNDRDDDRLMSNLTDEEVDRALSLVPPPHESVTAEVHVDETDNETENETEEDMDNKELGRLLMRQAEEDQAGGPATIRGTQPAHTLRPEGGVPEQGGAFSRPANPSAPPPPNRQSVIPRMQVVVKNGNTPSSPPPDAKEGETTQVGFPSPPPPPGVRPSVPPPPPPQSPFPLASDPKHSSPSIPPPPRRPTQRGLAAVLPPDNARETTSQEGDPDPLGILPTRKMEAAGTTAAKTETLSPMQNVPQIPRSLSSFVEPLPAIPPPVTTVPQSAIPTTPPTRPRQWVPPEMWRKSRSIGFVAFIIATIGVALFGIVFLLQRHPRFTRVTQDEAPVRMATEITDATESLLADTPPGVAARSSAVPPDFYLEALRIGDVNDMPAWEYVTVPIKWVTDPQTGARTPHTLDTWKCASAGSVVLTSEVVLPDGAVLHLAHLHGCAREIKTP